MGSRTMPRLNSKKANNGTNPPRYQSRIDVYANSLLLEVQGFSANGDDCGRITAIRRSISATKRI